MNMRHCFLQAKRSAGFSLIELMIGMTVGLFVSAAALSLFLSSSSTHRSVSQVANLLDSARTAISMIERDITLAGYWGLVGDTKIIWGRRGTADAINPAVNNDCDTGNAFAIDLEKVIQVFDNTAPSACMPAHLADTDVLVIRRAATGSGFTAGGNELYVNSDHSHGEVYETDDGPNSLFATINESRPLVVNAYYITDTTSDAGTRSSLRRLTLAAGPEFVSQELVPGVEDMQIELGLDMNGDGSADTYVSPTVAGANADRTVAVRVSLLLHASGIDPSYTDTGDYLLLGAAQKRIVGLPNRRVQYSKTITLRN